MNVTGGIFVRADLRVIAMLTVLQGETLNAAAFIVNGTAKRETASYLLTPWSRFLEKLTGL
jgi:surfactin synthase thioesterase subunit